MKTRLTGWLSLLLLVSAVFGLPVTRGPAGPAVRICAEVVCECREQRAVQVLPARLVPTALFVSGSPTDSGATSLLDYSLFQRPPPAA